MFLRLVVVFGATLALASMPQPGVYLNSEGSPALPLIESAKRRLDIEIYTMTDPTIHALIRKALDRGVEVRIIQEPTPVGGSCKLFVSDLLESNQSKTCAEQKKLISDVRSHGGLFVPFNKETLCASKNCLEHGKIIIADDTAMVSTGNLDSTNLCINNPVRCNRDFSLVTNEPKVVRALRDLFEADLNARPYQVESLIPHSLKQTLTVSPDSLGPIMDFINSAKYSIDLEQQYLKSQEMNQALIAAANRGVKVSMTIASFCAFGRPKLMEMEVYANVNDIYPEFDRAGISTRMFSTANRINGKPGYMHAKVIVVDGKRAWIGSVNGSNESLTRNREYGLIFSQPQWVRAVQKVLHMDHTSPDSESWQESLKCFKDREMDDLAQRFEL